MCPSRIPPGGDVPSLQNQPMKSPSPRALALSFTSLLAILSLPLRGADAPQAATGPRKSVRLLTIGNSLSNNMLSALPQLAKAGGKELIVFPANTSASKLEEHAMKFQQSEPGAVNRKPVSPAYRGRIDQRTGQKKDFNLGEALQSADWDFVSIQQYSEESYKPESFQPAAGILIDAIHKYAPHAQVLGYQTWAYPDEYIAKTGFKMSQAGMFKGIEASYQKLAVESHARVVPVGEAFQAARSLPKPIDLNGGDKHANPAGQFLAAAVFYEILFNENVESNPYMPNHVSPEDVKALRRIAHEVVAKAAGKTR